MRPRRRRRVFGISQWSVATAFAGAAFAVGVACWSRPAPAVDRPRSFTLTGETT